MHVDHDSPFVAEVSPVVDIDGSEARVAVVKATYQMGNDGVLAIAEEQEPISASEEYYGEPGRSSIVCESDGAYFKPGVDISVIGAAYAPDNRSAPWFDASISIGSISKTVRVIGDRCWRYTRIGGATPTRPQPVTRVPIRWERSFGGVDASFTGPRERAWESRNPIGTGFCATESRDSIDGVALPNFEDPKQLIQKWSDRPVPQGFGLIGRTWRPRVSYAGTYDEHWQRTRMPILPVDFDYRFFNAASPDLIAPGHLQGGELVTAVNLSRTGMERFALPTVHVTFKARAGGTRIETPGRLDTVVFKFDDRKIVLVWRAKYSVELGERLEPIAADIDFSRGNTCP
jgi:hypothetical protein